MIKKRYIKQCYVKCRKKTEDKNPNVVGTKNGRMMLLSKCEIVKNRNSLKNKKLMDYKQFKNKNIFIIYSFILIQDIKMNEIFNKFLLKFMPEMHLRQSGLHTMLMEIYKK